MKNLIELKKYNGSFIDSIENKKLNLINIIVKQQPELQGWADAGYSDYGRFILRTTSGLVVDSLDADSYGHAKLQLQGLHKRKFCNGYEIMENPLLGSQFHLNRNKYGEKVYNIPAWKIVRDFNLK